MKNFVLLIFIMFSLWPDRQWSTFHPLQKSNWYLKQKRHALNLFIKANKFDNEIEINQTKIMVAFIYCCSLKNKDLSIQFIIQRRLLKNSPRIVKTTQLLSELNTYSIVINVLLLFSYYIWCFLPLSNDRIKELTMKKLYKNAKPFCK